METELKLRNKRRYKRALRIRKHVRGTAEKPRMTVFKSNRHLSVQLINDETGHTLAFAGTLSKKAKPGKSKEFAKEIGKIIAERAKEQNIRTVVFDRGYYKFHGVIAEIATAARESGLQF